MSYCDPEQLAALLHNKDPNELDSYLTRIAKLDTLAGKVRALLCLRIPDDIAERRAPMLVEDMKAIGFELKLEVPRLASRLHASGLRVPIHYHIPHTNWTINRKEPTHALEGTHLDHGDLVRLSRVCEIGRKLIPNEWPKRFAHELMNPVHHLDVINEVWWLSRFVDPTEIYKPDRGSTKPSPDWRFSIQTGRTAVRVNLEVKRRCADIKRHLGLKNRSELFDDIAKKFLSRHLAEINVGAVTIYSAIDEEIEAHAREWLVSHSTVDAVILWSEQSHCSPPLAFVTRGQLEFLLRDCLSPPDEEDTSGVAILKHLILDCPDFPFIPSAR